MTTEEPGPRSEFEILVLVTVLAGVCVVFGAVLIGLLLRDDSASPANATRSATADTASRVHPAPTPPRADDVPDREPRATDAAGADAGAVPRPRHTVPGTTTLDRRGLTGTIGRHASSSEERRSAALSPPAIPPSLSNGGEVTIDALPNFGAVAPALPPVAPPSAAFAGSSLAARAGGGFAGESAVLASLVRRYEAAYRSRDAAATASLWPSVNQEALERAFARLRTQNLALKDCTFVVGASDATATCAGVLQYSQAVGDTSVHTDQHVWTMEFVRAGDAWAISRIKAQ